MKATPPASRSFLRLPGLIRMMIYLPVVAVVLFFVLRQLEYMVTYHPTPYVPGPDWTLPPNGEGVGMTVGSGERVHGWSLQADSQPAIATVLYCHGNGGNLSNVAWVARDLAKLGFNTMVFDYRGYGRSEGSLTDG